MRFHNYKKYMGSSSYVYSVSYTKVTYDYNRIAAIEHNKYEMELVEKNSVNKFGLKLCIINRSRLNWRH